MFVLPKRWPLDSVTGLGRRVPPTKEQTEAPTPLLDAPGTGWGPRGLILTSIGKAPDLLGRCPSKLELIVGGQRATLQRLSHSIS